MSRVLPELLHSHVFSHHAQMLRVDTHTLTLTHTTIPHRFYLTAAWFYCWICSCVLWVFSLPLIAFSAGGAAWLLEGVVLMWAPAWKERACHQCACRTAWPCKGQRAQPRRCAERSKHKGLWQLHRSSESPSPTHQAGAEQSSPPKNLAAGMPVA